MHIFPSLQARQLPLFASKSQGYVGCQVERQLLRKKWLEQAVLSSVSQFLITGERYKWQMEATIFGSSVILFFPTLVGHRPSQLQKKWWLSENPEATTFFNCEACPFHGFKFLFVGKQEKKRHIPKLSSIGPFPCQ